MRVSPSLEYDRALATIGLLRHVTDAVPVDAVCVYSNQTKQPYGIRQLTEKIGYYDHWYSEKPQKTIRDEKEDTKEYVIPNSLIKMTKDYIARSFWNQIDHLRGGDRICIDTGCCWDRGDMNATVRAFPKDVLNTIAGLRLSKYANLWDSKNAIAALHAVCVPDSFERPKYFFRDNAPTTDVLKIEHKRNISILSTILSNYCWNATNRQSVPNQAEKNLLLDLIESLTILFGLSSDGNRSGFFDNYARKQIYEFARTTDKLDRSRNLRFLSAQGATFDTRVGQGSWDLSRTNKYIEDIRHISAEAAICLRTVASDPNDPRTYSFVPNPTELAKLKPQPLNEVAIYLSIERNVAWIKARKLQGYLQERERRENGECVCEPCCAEDPCGY